MSHSIDKLINNFFYKLANNKDNSFVSDYIRPREHGERGIRELFSKYEDKDIKLAATILNIDISNGIENLSRIEQYALKNKLYEFEYDRPIDVPRKERTAKEILESLQQPSAAAQNAIARARGHKNTNLEAYPMSGQLEYKVTSEGDFKGSEDGFKGSTNKPTQPSNSPPEPDLDTIWQQAEEDRKRAAEEDRRRAEIQKATREGTLTDLLKKEREELEKTQMEERKNRPSLRR